MRSSGGGRGIIAYCWNPASSSVERFCGDPARPMFWNVWSMSILGRGDLRYAHDCPILSYEDTRCEPTYDMLYGEG